MERFEILGVLILVFLQFFLQAECGNSPSLDKAIEKCKAKIGLEKFELVASIADHEKITPEQKSMAIELIGCIWTDLGLINEQGELNEEKLTDFLVKVRDIPKDAATKIVEQCKTVDGKDYGEKAYNINICLHAEAGKM